MFYFSLIKNGFSPIIKELKNKYYVLPNLLKQTKKINNMINPKQNISESQILRQFERDNEFVQSKERTMEEELRIQSEDDQKNRLLDYPDIRIRHYERHYRTEIRKNYISEQYEKALTIFKKSHYSEALDLKNNLENYNFEAINKLNEEVVERLKSKKEKPTPKEFLIHTTYYVAILKKRKLELEQSNIITKPTIENTIKRLKIAENLVSSLEGDVKIKPEFSKIINEKALELIKIHDEINNFLSPIMSDN